MSGQDVTAVEMVVSEDDPRREDVIGLLAHHHRFVRGESPPQDVHALDIDGLVKPSITFFSCRQPDGVLLGIGALSHLDSTSAEVKSMHTAAEARGRGVANAVLLHMIEAAGERGYERLLLETGSMEAFGPAHRLYRRAGFVTCGPFADYLARENSLFFALSLR